MKESYYYSNGEWEKSFNADDDIRMGETYRIKGTFDLGLMKQIDAPDLKLGEALRWLRGRLNNFKHEKVKASGYNPYIDISKIYNYEDRIESQIKYYEGQLNDMQFMSKEDVESNNVKPPPPKETEPTHSFKYQTKENLEHLGKVFDALKNNNKGIAYLKAEVTQNQFFKIFQNTPLPIKKIDWQISIVSLKYFIQQLPFENKFEIATYCFTCKGEKLTKKQLLNANGNTKTIKKILKTLPFQ